MMVNIKKTKQAKANKPKQSAVALIFFLLSHMIGSSCSNQLVIDSTSFNRKAIKRDCYHFQTDW